MTDLLEKPPIDWLNAVGRRIFDAWDYDQEAALEVAQRIWKEPRIAQIKGEEAVETWLREWQEKRKRKFGPQKPVEAWMEAYKREWARLCAGEWDFESPYSETYDLWLKHYASNPKVVATRQRERYRQMSQKKLWIDLIA